MTSESSICVSHDTKISAHVRVEKDGRHFHNSAALRLTCSEDRISSHEIRILTTNRAGTEHLIAALEAATLEMRTALDADNTENAPVSEGADARPGPQW